MLDPKGNEQFPQWHWADGEWVSGVPKDWPPILYRLPELLKSPATTIVYVTEGEGDADALADPRLGFVATTAGGVTSKWTPEMVESFRDRRVVIFCDADKKGRAYAQKVARLLDPVTQSIKVIDLHPDRSDGEDVRDWLKTDSAAVKLMTQVREAPDWEPSETKDEPGDDATKSDDETGDDEASDDAKPVSKKQSDELLKLASEAELFHTPAGEAYADVMVDGHRETHRVRSRSFRLWLLQRYFERFDGAPNSDAVQSALNVTEARALFKAPEIEVHLRVAEHEGKVYLDLADKGWQVVEVDTEGWRVVSSPPVRFRRASGMLPLPEPVHGGSIDALRPLLNVQSESDFVLTVAWLLAAMRDRGPYPIMVVSGENGAAKTSFCKVLRALVDPNSAPMRALSREDRDFFIAANNGYVLAFDNVSGLPTWISDTLCRLATGGGFSTRQLFSDDAEILFDAMRPIVLNGIEDFAVRPDLVDRAILLTLETVPDDKRRPEKELWAELDRKHPQLLGALLDAVVHGLRELPNVQLTKLPRMADFALWATACETAFGWPAETFMAAYAANREDAVSGTLEADLVATATRAFITDRTAWEGTASLLLDTLGLLVTETQRRGKGWPTTPHQLTGRLRRAASSLRKIGIKIDFVREGKKGTRTIHITRLPDNGGQTASAASAAISIPTS